MIKINLLRSAGLDQSGGGDIVTTDMQKQAAFKIIVIILFPLLLYGYESFNLSNLNESVQAEQTKIAEQEKKLAEFGDIAPRVEKYTKQKKKIEGQRDKVRVLSKDRLRGLKALDSIQSLTPSQVWFSTIAVDGDHVRATGYSNTEEGIATLYASLNNSPVFSKFEPKSQTETTVGDFKVKAFEVEFVIGKKEEVAP